MIRVYASYCKSGVHVLHYPAIAFCECVALRLNLPINDKTLRDLGVTVCADPVHIYPSPSLCVIQCTSIHLSHSALDIYMHTYRERYRESTRSTWPVYCFGTKDRLRAWSVFVSTQIKTAPSVVHLPPSLPIKPTWLCLWQHPHSSPRRPPARPPRKPSRPLIPLSAYIQILLLTQEHFAGVISPPRYFHAGKEANPYSNNSARL